MGALAVRKIADMIESGHERSIKTLVSAELIVRGSCGAVKP
jgi:DNA-binding LacI/PurR family transcriptional regulator